MSEMIQFDRVHRAFGTQPVLKDLSFAVREGEVFALLGRNGAGKTTALRILLGFLEPRAGTSSVLGVDSQRFSPRDRERIGFVSEDHRLPRQKRVDALLDFEQATRRRFDRAHAETMLKALALRGRAKVGSLSRGQRAQLALAIALAGRPEVLVFDDPAMGLDVPTRRELLDQMIDRLGEGGTSVLLTSHVFSDVERLADRIGILHDGALIVDAPLDQLKRRVTRCALTWTAGHSGQLAHVEGVLADKPRDGGFEVTCLDFDADLRARLQATGARVSEPFPSSLEDLFVELTRSPREHRVEVER
ncbi:MAG: ABC transporter ATP-binding protein [Planctomycetes bacterium]|nr:ABC transporter ATP-binding protein [Planctomycetota bacterium]